MSSQTQDNPALISDGPRPASAELDIQRLLLFRQAGIEPQYFLDIGASDGRWSRAVSEVFPEANFDLFEPLIEHAPRYQEKMKPTLASHPRLSLHPVALGPTCKRVRMHVDENLVGSTALELGTDGPTHWATVEVDMLTIDHFREQFQRPVPQVIKMDTQGCELGILQGAQRTLPGVDLVLVECWLQRCYGSATPLLLEVAEWLRRFDFHLWDLAGCYRKAGELVSQDCFFLNARSKVSRLGKEAGPGLTPVAAPAQPGLARLLRRVQRLLGRRSGER